MYKREYIGEPDDIWLNKMREGDESLLPNI